MNKALEKACEIVGSQNKMAKIVGVSRQAVYQWFDSQIPANRVLDIEKATKGKVTRYELRPDIYGKKNGTL